MCQFNILVETYHNIPHIQIYELGNGTSSR